jgi:ssDNA-binding Zn-finger/Zn-ribbon topoisomerase 1
MLTTTNFYEDDKKVIHRCPKCGHQGEIGCFEFRLPSAARCSEGASVYYTVDVPTGDVDEHGRAVVVQHRMDKPPTRDEIAALCEQAGLAEKPRRKRRSQPEDQPVAAEE